MKLPSYAFPSFVFAAIGVALVVLGIAGLVYGDSDKARAISAVVAALGVLQVIFGGIKRRSEDATVTAPTAP